MKPSAFFHAGAVREILRQASRAAAMSVSVHPVGSGDADEGLAVAGFGRCAACRHVAGIPGGPAACRESRVPFSLTALRRGKPTPFLCHMGFACVAIPALPETDSGLVMTFGPFCPAGTQQGLDHDFRKGLKNLERPLDKDELLPAPLSEIHIIPAEAVPTLAEWTAERIAHVWFEYRDEPESAPEPELEEPGRAVRRRFSQTPGTGPHQASELVMALAAGNQAQARALLRSALSETQSGEKVRLAVRRARAVAVVGAALEAAERAGIDAEKCWGEFAEFVATVRKARADSELSAAVLRLLNGVKPGGRRKREIPAGLAELNDILSARLAEGITLNEVASMVGEHPTAITHRLQRKFGLSFSQYLGRLRINKAKELLRRTRLDIAEIAWRVGIRDAANFGKLFRKHESCSPTLYREKFRSKK